MREQKQPYSDQNEQENYRSLYTRFYKKLYNYGYKFTADITLIEDSIQDIFLAYWKRKDTHLAPDAIGSYLFSAFRYSLFRKITRERRLSALTTAEEEPDFSTDHFIIHRETTREMQQQVQAALRQLTGRQREALFLRFYEGLSYEEIAVVLNISVKASYKLMARSLLQLKNGLSLPVWLLLCGYFMGINKNY